ncbi:unnamed protein product, partial [Ectocarpus fasciculatus]
GVVPIPHTAVLSTPILQMTLLICPSVPLGTPVLTITAATVNIYPTDIATTRTTPRSATTTVEIAASAPVSIPSPFNVARTATPA